MAATECGCGRPIPPRTGPGKPRTRCEVCAPSRSKRAALTTVPETPRAPAGPVPLVGLVEEAARAALADLDSIHPAAALLIAAAQRLARDVDKASEVRDRVAATRAIVELVRELDVAPGPSGTPAGDEDGGAARGSDPFDIGDMPPGVGDAQAS